MSVVNVWSTETGKIAHILETYKGFLCYSLQDLDFRLIYVTQVNMVKPILRKRKERFAIFMLRDVVLPVAHACAALQKTCEGARAQAMLNT